MATLLRSQRHTDEAQDNLAAAKEDILQFESEFSNRKLGWGAGCFSGAAMTAVGFLMSRHGKARVTTQHAAVGSEKPASSRHERTCPFCAETIKIGAIKCRFCGADLPRQPLQPFVAPEAPPVMPKFIRKENGSIHFECGCCAQRIAVDASGGGAEVKCPECGERQIVPIS
jgi:predicted RNA-binding Zn-ribbon protein involved in translation (DUF1610 family)